MTPEEVYGLVNRDPYNGVLPSLYNWGNPHAMFTPWKINMEPKNHPIEKENHLPNHHFQVPC